MSQKKKGTPADERRGIWTAVLVALVLTAIPVAVFLVPRYRTADRVTPAPAASREDHLHAIQVDPRAPGRIYVGSHTGLYVSEDGADWALLALRGQDVMGLAGGGDRLLAAGHDLLAVSRDGGRTWEAIKTDLPGYDIHGLAASPGNPDVSYVNVMGKGIYRSGDGGRSWQRAGDGPADMLIALAVDAGDEDTVYAGDMDAGVFKSTDGGRTWTPAGEGIRDRRMTALAAVPGQPGVVFAAGADGVLKTEDGGRTWRRAGQGLPAGSALAVAVNPLQPAQVYAFLLADGFYVSEDGGASWSPLPAGDGQQAPSDQ